MMLLPPGLWTMVLAGQYLQPNGKPQQGYVLITPQPPSISATAEGTPVTVVLQTCRLDLDAEGFLRDGSGDLPQLLNPNDPGIRPGPATGQTWMYHVQETFQMGAVIEWLLSVPDDIGDGDTLDLAKVTRHNEQVLQPADWFPKHLIDTPVQAGRISPRGGALLRSVEPSGS